MSAPDSSEAWIDPIWDAIISDVQRVGHFSSINKSSEPKRAPATQGGLTAAVWMQNMKGVGAISGLKATSGVLVFNVRIYSNMLIEPQDEIDPRMLRAASRLMREWHEEYDFDLDPLVRNVDVLGMTGIQLDCNAGYLEMDRKNYRIYDITLPVIVNDIWPQGS